MHLYAMIITNLNNKLYVVLTDRQRRVMCRLEEGTKQRLPARIWFLLCTWAFCRHFLNFLITLTYIFGQMAALTTHWRIHKSLLDVTPRCGRSHKEETHTDVGSWVSLWMLSTPGDGGGSSSSGFAARSGPYSFPGLVTNAVDSPGFWWI